MKTIISFMCVIFLLLSFGIANAIEKDGFVLNVKTDGAFLKEIDGIAELPFDTEYTILLKNNNDRRCSARVFIDGTRVSPDGDFVIGPKDKLELQRFVTDLEKGRKFKFVSLDNPAVDDPTRKENGLIRVEFRFEKRIQFGGPDWNFEWDDCDCNNIGGTLFDCNCDAMSDHFLFDTSLSSIIIPTGSITDDSLTTSASNGATIAGSKSTQKFRKVNYDFETEFVTLELRLRRIPIGTLPIPKMETKYCDPLDQLGTGIDLSCFVFKKTDSGLYWKYEKNSYDGMWDDVIPGPLMKALMNK